LYNIHYRQSAGETETLGAAWWCCQWVQNTLGYVDSHSLQRRRSHLLNWNWRKSSL